MSAWVAGGMAVVGMASAISGQKAAAAEADRKRAAEMAAATMKYAATESSVNLMKSANREVTANAIQETLRAGAANNRDVADQVQQVASKAISQSEGLTSGRTKGRQMVSLYVKGNEMMQESKTQTASVINKLTDQQDQRTNDLNNSLLAAHQDMASVLTTPGNIYSGNDMAILQAGVQGAASGASLSSSFASAAPASSSSGVSLMSDVDSAGWGYDPGNL